MSLSSYKVFDAVATKKSLVKAAEELNLTPSAVSHSLMKLEKELGFKLMHRDRNGIKLTTQGTVLLPTVRDILQCEYKLHEEVDKLNGLKTGTVNIGTFNSVCANWLPDIIKRFGVKYPGIKLNVYQGGYQDMEEWLVNLRVDLSFVSAGTVTEGLTVSKLIEDPLLCITPMSFHSKHEGFITIAELMDQTLIYPDEGYNVDTDVFVRNNRLIVDKSHNIQDDMSLIALVESGLGFCILPELLLKKVNGNIKIHEIESRPYRTIGIATSDEKYLTTATKALIDEIKLYMDEKYSSIR